ncbi:MAG: NADH:ubiquinone reductase (Na(+)-transporting) subunit D, partial [Methylococcales bacterium]|nr:NADH:ubiquinone reductase (Na(+)-transporting) subunit D [Methylococcales bacterium]
MSAVMSNETKKILTEPLVNNNPITLQVLGICSALAVTSQMSTSLIMAIALTSVTACSSAAISSI